MTKRNKRLIIIGCAFSIAAIAVALTLTALNSALVFFYTPSSLAELAARPTGVIRLGGIVATGSVEFDESDEARVKFVVEDEFGQLPVSYEGHLPDLFREGQGVVVQGRLNESGQMVAMNVLAKHDETYMPRELADALKEQGRWKGAAPN